MILQVEFCPIWSSRSIPAPRALNGTRGMVHEWMRADQRLLGDQQCVSPGPPLHPHEEASYIPVSALPLTLAPPTSEDRCDTGKLPAAVAAASLLKHTSSDLAVFQRDAEPGKSISMWGTNPDILGRNKEKGVGRRK